MSMRTGGSACTHSAAPDATNFTGPVAVAVLRFAGQVIRLVRPAEPDRLLDDPEISEIKATGSFEMINQVNIIQQFESAFLGIGGVVRGTRRIADGHDGDAGRRVQFLDDFIERFDAVGSGPVGGDEQGADRLARGPDFSIGGGAVQSDVLEFQEL
jgi:hypothetical protein